MAKICYILNKKNSRNTQKRPNNCFCKNLHWIVCANFINLQKNDKQTVFEVYLTLTMPLNHAFRFLFKYGGRYLNCTYNYVHVCTPTKYENIWTNMSWYNSSVTLLTHAHFVSTTHIHNIIIINFFCYFMVTPIMFNYYRMLNQSYIYRLVWKMQVNCQCYTPDELRVFTLNLSLQKIQCDYECQLVIYKKPKECKHWILKNKCVIYLHVFIQMN